MVLLKGVDAGGFVFFTNYESRKGLELAANPWAALVFYWPELERQVRIEGRVERISPEESDAYFASRPNGSRIGAWASRQSSVIGGRAELEQRVAELEQFYADRPIPRPPFLGRFSRHSRYHRVLAGAPESPARPSALPARRRWLDC